MDESAADDSARNPSLRAGFTLIELSIVLVIIGLIVGGVLVGRDLIKAATLRSVLTDIDKFNVAVMTFQGKYNCLPGDCANATALFGTYDCSAGYGVPAGSGTCNGDGDNKVGMSAYAGNGFYFKEATLFWQQLSIAGLVAGTYTGAIHSDAGSTPDVPVSKLEKASYCVDYSDAASAADPMIAPTYPMDAHYFSIGGAGGYGCYTPLQSLMAVDAQSIDKKIDDGMPVTGNVQAVTYIGWGEAQIQMKPYIPVALREVG